MAKKKEELAVFKEPVVEEGQNVAIYDHPYMSIIPPEASIQELKLFAEIAVKSAMFKGTTDIAKAIMKMKAGQEMGMGIFESMSSFDIIEGKIEINADASARAIKRSGKYNYTVVQIDNSACILEFWQLRDGEWVPIGRSIFGVAEMKQAGLDQKGDTYRKYTRNMFFARAMTNGLAWYCPDAVRIRQYGIAEIQNAMNAKHSIQDSSHIDTDAGIESDRSELSNKLTSFIMGNESFLPKWKEVVEGIYRDFTLDDKEYFKRLVGMFTNIGIDILQEYKEYVESTNSQSIGEGSESTTPKENKESQEGASGDTSSTT
jgi:hypothetical protein